MRSYGLHSSRKELIQSFIDQGWNVITASGSDKYTNSLIEMGAHFRELKFYRGGLSLSKDTKTYFDIRKIIKVTAPDIIHIFHSKPSILGNLACLGFKGKLITTMTGLGHSVMNGGVKEKITALAYKLSLWKSDKVIFLNPDDLNYCLDRKIVKKNKSELIISSGIKTENYVNLQLTKPKIPRILFAGRLLRDKGIYEFVEAAENVKRKHEVEFIIAGEVDEDHPASVSIDWITDKHDKGIIQFIGYCSRLSDEFVKSTVFVLPSYGEGVPRVILEASASGLPIITTDVNGCRTAIANNQTGILVEPRNALAIQEAIEKILDNPDKGIEMGQKGKKWIAENFDRKVILSKYLKVYRDLGIEINEAN